MRLLRTFTVAATLLTAFATLTQAATSHVFNVQDYGATGQRADTATRALQAAIDACATAGGGRVYVPPGDYTTGAIFLKDNVDLHLEAGATLFLSQNQAEFPPHAHAMINADGAQHIAVTGRGRFDGLARYVFADERGDDPSVAEAREIARRAGLPMKRYYRDCLEAYLFVLNRCTDVRLEGVELVHSPLWNIRLDHCDRVLIHDIHIYSDLEKGVNADGIDLVSTRNVTISDCIIVTGDDAIALKTEGRIAPPAPTENIAVTNCILTSSSSAFTIGTETHADVRHVVVSHCIIRDSNKGIGINVQDGATVSDIVFSHLTMDSRRRHWNWWGSAEAFRFTLRKRRPDSKLGAIRDIVIDHFIAHARGTSTIVGATERPIENVTISDLQLFMEPENTPDKRASDAIQIDGVAGLKLRDVSVRWSDDQPEPKWQSALRLKNVTDLKLDNFTGRQALKDSPTAAVVLENIRGALIRDSQAAAGSGIFLELRGLANANICLRNNDSSRARQPLIFTAGATESALTSP